MSEMKIRRTVKQYDVILDDTEFSISNLPSDDVVRKWLEGNKVRRISYELDGDYNVTYQRVSNPEEPAVGQRWRKTTVIECVICENEERKKVLRTDDGRL